MKTSTAGNSGGLNWRIIGWGTAAVLLLMPLFAMQVTDEVNWTASDFVFAGLMFGTVGLILELAVRRTGDWTYRLAAAVAAAAGFMTLWANGAVGIVGSENREANTFFNLVPLIALLGAIAVRARAAAMFRLMLAVGIIQAAIAPAIFMLGEATRDGTWLRELVFASGLFPAIWLTSAALFRAAARKQLVV